MSLAFDDYPIHDSIRGWFGRELYFELQSNPNAYLITADLGYKLFDLHKEDFPKRFINVGAAESCAVGSAIGLALSGKQVWVYSITTFLIFRAFEWHRNFLNHENIPVFLIGSGYGDDYKHDGITHQPFEVREVLHTLPNIKQYYPTDKEEVPNQIRDIIRENQPAFMCLRR